MEWTHLPVAGGLYDQHPKLLDDWMVIFGAKGEKAQRDKDKADRERAAASRK